MKCLHNANGIGAVMKPQSKKPLADSILNLIEYASKRLGYGVFGEKHVHVCLNLESYLDLHAGVGQLVPQSFLSDTIVNQRFFGLPIRIDLRKDARRFCLKGNKLEIGPDYVLKINGVAV